MKISQKHFINLTNCHALCGSSTVDEVAKCFVKVKDMLRGDEVNKSLSRGETDIQTVAGARFQQELNFFGLEKR